MDVNNTMWLPLVENTTIIQQPVDTSTLAPRYVEAASRFIADTVAEARPFFLYMPFSHLHQLCGPTSPQWASTMFANKSGAGPVVDAVEEVDWMTGKVLDAVDAAGARDNTLVIWT